MACGRMAFATKAPRKSLPKTIRSVDEKSLAIRKKKTSRKETKPKGSKNSKKGGKSGRKSRRTRQVRSNNITSIINDEIRSILEQIRPGFSISDEALAEVNSFMERMFQGVSTQSSALAKRKVVRRREVRLAILSILPGELASYHVGDIAQEPDVEMDQV